MRKCYSCHYCGTRRVHRVTGVSTYECRKLGRPINPELPECPVTEWAWCDHCNKELESIIAVKEESNLYQLTLNDDEEFYETRSSDITEYLCPKCFGILSTHTVNKFRELIHEH